MSEVIVDLLFCWLPLAFLLVQWVFLLTLLALMIYAVIFRIKIDHEAEELWIGDAAHNEPHDRSSMLLQREQHWPVA